DGAEKQIAIGKPDHGDQRRNGPDHLSVFLAGGETAGVADDDGKQNGLPGPEDEVGQFVGYQPYPAGALYHIERRSKQGTAAEGKDHQIGMNRSKASEAEPGQVEIECGPDQLSGKYDTHGHTEHAPDQGHDGEFANNIVVIAGLG